MKSGDGKAQKRKFCEAICPSSQDKRRGSRQFLPSSVKWEEKSSGTWKHKCKSVSLSHSLSLFAGKKLKLSSSFDREKDDCLHAWAGHFVGSFPAQPFYLENVLPEKESTRGRKNANDFLLPGRKLVYLRRGNFQFPVTFTRIISLTELICRNYASAKQDLN